MHADEELLVRDLGERRPRGDLLVQEPAQLLPPAFARREVEQALGRAGTPDRGVVRQVVGPGPGGVGPVDDAVCGAHVGPPWSHEDGVRPGDQGPGSPRDDVPGRAGHGVHPFCWKGKSTEVSAAAAKF